MEGDVRDLKIPCRKFGIALLSITLKTLGVTLQFILQRRNPVSYSTKE